jgi:hypothetical protein
MFIIALGLKLNDYQNFINMPHRVDDSVDCKWYKEGWITIAFELGFIVCYLTIPLLKLVVKLVNKVKGKM